MPICSGGKIKLPSGKEIDLTRIHIEEDPASLVHAGGIQASSYSFIDYNRSGTPLLEMVTEPQITSAEEAKDFLKTLIGVLSYLNIFDMKQGLMKADVNVSIKNNDYKRVEVKNINGFRDIQKAIEYEIKRQNNCAKEGKETGNETRGWDSEESSTYLLRKKESEDDYGYIIDADIAPYNVTKEDLEQDIPKLPVDFAEEISKKYNIDFKDVFIIANQKIFGEVYLKAVEIDPKLVTNWFRHIIPTPYISKYGDLLEVEEINEKEIIELLKLFKQKKVSDKVAKNILSKLVEEKFSPAEYIKKNNLEMVSDTGEIKKICEEVVKENPSAIEDYKKGEDKSINYMVGQVMKKSKGKANPGEARKIILEIIN
ncbi:MAG: Asp-tRNA(Asn)/Glu-tRNA(Gln) amidotransferase subunit GatB, partial [Nanobdellota archaeon]